MYSFEMRLIILFLIFSFPSKADNHIIDQENFDSWQFSCVEEKSKKICDLRELVFDPNTEEVVSYVSITINPDNLTQMQIAFPHAVNLKNPIKFQIDDKESFDLSYSYCNESACFVAEIIAENFVNLFKSGNQVSIKASLLDTREATITYSLTGFTAGYERLLQEVTN